MKTIKNITILLLCPVIIFSLMFAFLPKYNVTAGAKKNQASDYMIALDAGHEKIPLLSKERVDPNNKSLGTKAKMVGGCTSYYNHMPEYKYTLIIAKKLQAKLLKKGYKVYMVRNKNNVKLGCQKRAKMINKSGSVIAIRLHCDSYGHTAYGVSTIYKPGHNSYYSKSDAMRSKVLGSYILSGECKSTGFHKRTNNARNDMTGQNWSKIPVALIEMGFFSNFSEAKKMSRESYKEKITNGIYNGINKYMKKYYHVF